MVLSLKENTIEILKIKLDFLTRDLKKTADLINHLQNDEPFEVQENNLRDEGWARRIKRSRVNTDELEKRKSSITDEIKTLEKEIKKMVKSNRKIATFYVFPVVVMAFFLLYFITGGFDQPIQSEQLRSHYLIQNLRGDTIDTWASWRIPEDRLFHIHIKNSPQVSDESAQVIFDVIMSDETLSIDDSLLHKGPKGSLSTYYTGWHGALNSINVKTKFIIPKNLHSHITDVGDGDVIIQLSDKLNSDGFSGFTNSIVDEANNQILKSTITIYDIDRISTGQLKTILRHELGHGFGLAHSSAPEDLMAPQITTNYPYISGCDLDAITLLYDGGQTSQVVCEK